MKQRPRAGGVQPALGRRDLAAIYLNCFLSTMTRPRRRGPTDPHMMIRTSRAICRWLLARLRVPVAVAVVASALLLPVSAHPQGLFGERKYAYELSDVIAQATEFTEKENYWEAYGRGTDGDRSLLGYVFLTDNLVEIPGYSGHTLNTLVGIDPTGKIVGIKLIRHSEPIVLIGLNEQVMHDFIGQYVGKDVRDRVIISDTPRQGYVSVDGITGATVTAVAENATILEAGRSVGRTVGIVKASEVRSRRPSQQFEPLDWQGLTARGAVGNLIVHPQDIDQDDGPEVLNIRFAVLDPPAVGRNLLGERFYKIVEDRLAEKGGSALFVGATGTSSFKGAGFARGGIFDRFSLEQRGDLFVFKDVDFINFFELAPEQSPRLKEGGIFFVESNRFDPTDEFTLHLTLPYRVNDKRTYGTFLRDYQLPKEFVVEDVPFWVTRWRGAAAEIAAFATFLLVAAAMFAFRKRLVPYRKLLHYSIAAISVVWVGIILKAQPSMTQVFTLANSGVRQKFPLEVFLSEPAIFLFWIAIVLSLLVWGRGFFCGWLCPYGALLELLVAGWERICPEKLHKRIEAWQPGPLWRSGKYVTFVFLLAVAVVNLPAAEMFGEVEPFKTFILRLVRPLPFVSYFVVITLVSAVVYRFFCRFLCPLGGGLAIPSSSPLHRLVRYEQCSSCKICFRGCEPKAISFETGDINYRECLQCWDCQMTATEEKVCPELIQAKRDGRSPRVTAGAVCLAMLFAPSVSTAATLTVRPGAGAIGAAIAASSEGDTIVVEPGVYRENVVIDKRITLIGKKGAVISAGGSGHALVVEASSSVVEGLTLRDCGRDQDVSESGIRIEKDASDVKILRNHVYDCRFGIWVHGSERTQIIGNRVDGIAEIPRGERGDCIHLWAARKILVQDNTISECRDGVYMELAKECHVIGNTILKSRYSVHTMWCDHSVYNENFAAENYVGLALMFSTGIEAKRNILYNNSTHGILLTQVTRSEASDNVIISNTKGVFVYNSLYNTIRGNLIARNNLGLHYWGGAEENIVEDNTLIGNEIQVKFVAARDQQWVGNFWSDYVGWDIDGNGHGDVPYLSNTLVDSLLWKYPMAKMLLASPALQMLAMAEREFPVITVPKGVDPNPLMEPAMKGWQGLLDKYPAKAHNYYGKLAKLPHIPGERR